MTWTASADSAVVRYRIYRSDSAIDALNLGSADLIADHWENSSRFYADRRYAQGTNTWQTRYFERFVIENGGAELSATTELLVWTLAEDDFGGGSSGSGYYAVTSVDDQGVENVLDFTSANAVGPIAENIATPQPVLGKLMLNGKVEVYIKYLDLRDYNATLIAPNANNDWYGLSPSAPEVANALQYAVVFAVFPPYDPICMGGATEFPVVVTLHGYGGQTVRPWTYDPDPTWCNAFRIYPVDVADTWWFGNAREHDYRTGLLVEPTDTIENYTERWVLEMVESMLNDPVHGATLDPDRTYLVGHSMGGSGALAFALRYGNVFAGIHASQPMTNYLTSGAGGGTDWLSDAEIKWGQHTDELPVEIDGPNGTADHLQSFNGISVWDWQNHQQQIVSRRGSEYAPFGIDHGLLDTVIEWSTQGQPFYEALDNSSICWAGEILNVAHVPSHQSMLPGAMQEDNLGLPFFGWKSVIGESLPGFSETSDASPLPPTAATTFNDAIDWSTSWDNWDGAPLDEADAWQTSLRTNDASTLSTRVTPRRIQAFEIESDFAYRWSNTDVTSGLELDSGTFTADADGLLTTAPVIVTPDGSRVRIEKSLRVDVDSISISTGGTQHLEIALGAEMAGKLVWMLGSVTGTSPGIPVDGKLLPLNFDAYTQAILSLPSTAVLNSSISFVAGDGRATSSFSLPVGVKPKLAGTVLYHAFAVLDLPGTGALLHVSNPTQVLLAP